MSSGSRCLEPMTLRFGDKLAYLRQQHGITQADLARRLAPGSRFHINNIEAGRKKPSLDFALRVATFFGVSVDYLLRDDIPVELPHAFARSAPDAIKEETRIALGSKVRRLRVQSGRTQVELAQELGLQTQAHISLLENGQSDISLSLVIRLAELFGVSIDYLVRDSESLEDPREFPGADAP